MAAKVEYNEKMCAFLKEMNASHYQIPPDMVVESYHKPFCDVDATTRKIGPHSLMQYAVNFGLCEATASEMCSVAFESTTNGNTSNNALTVNASSYVSDASSCVGGTDGLCEGTAWRCLGRQPTSPCNMLEKQTTQIRSRTRSVMLVKT